MKAIGSILIVISLVVGSIAAATVYYAPLSLPDEAFQMSAATGEPAYLELTAPAGLVRTEEGDREPLVKAGTPLTQEVLTTLRGHELQRADGSTPELRRIRVSAFSFGRWKEKWWFLLASLGLVAGAALLRLDARRRAASAEPTGVGTKRLGPTEAIAAVKATLETLADRLSTGTDEERSDAVVVAIDKLRRRELDAFIENRDRLIGRHGLAGFAQIMDRFAAMERQINRAWSAAADGVLEEAEECVGQALRLVDEVEATMRR